MLDFDASTKKNASSEPQKNQEFRFYFLTRCGREKNEREEQDFKNDNDE